MRVFSNLATSIDGKIADASAPSKMLGTLADKKAMSKLRAEADVILTGSTTLKAYPHTYRVKLKHLPKAKQKKFRYAANAIVSASGVIDPELEFWNDPEVVRFVFTTRKGYQAAMHSARERAFVVACGEGPQVDLQLALERLKESGLKNVLVEGGGEMMASFLAANLLQEIHLTLTPWVLGGRANPTLVGGVSALAPWKNLTLKRVKRVKNELFLTYKVAGAKRV